MTASLPYFESFKNALRRYIFIAYKQCHSVIYPSKRNYFLTNEPVKLFWNSHLVKGALQRLEDERQGKSSLLIDGRYTQPTEQNAANDKEKKVLSVIYRVNTHVQTWTTNSHLKKQSNGSRNVASGKIAK